MATEEAPSDSAIAEQEEVLNEEFQCYVRVGKSFIKTFLRPKDLEMSNDLLKRCEVLNKSKNIEVKKYTNEFFRLFLKVLRWTSSNQPTDIYERWFPPDSKNSENVGTWLEDKKSYMDSKSLDDGTILAYVALATDPEAGWQEYGLRALKKAADEEKEAAKPES